MRRSLANVDWVGLALFLAAFVVLRWKKCNPIPVMAACGVIQLGLGLIFPEFRMDAQMPCPSDANLAGHLAKAAKSDK